MTAKKWAEYGMKLTTEESVTRKHYFSLTSGTAIVEIPLPLEIDEIEPLKEWLNMMIRGLEKSKKEARGKHGH